MSSNKQEEQTKSNEILNLSSNQESDKSISLVDLSIEPDKSSLSKSLSKSSTRSSVQNISKPHSVHSLKIVEDIASELVQIDDDLVKSDSQLNDLIDDFTTEIKIDKNIDLNKSLENLREVHTSMDKLDPNSNSQTIISLSKSSLNNLLINEDDSSTISRSLNNVTNLDNENKINLTSSSNQTSQNESTISSSNELIKNNLLNQKYLNPSISNDRAEQKSSFIELDDRDKKLREKTKQSTGSIDFIPNFIATQSKFDDSSINRININQDDEMIIESYSSSIEKEIFYYLVSILTLGLFFIYCEVNRPLKIRLTHTKCPLAEATIVILIDQNNFKFVEKVERPTLDGKTNHLTHFYHKKLKYVWNTEREQFIKLTGLESEKCKVIYSYMTGLTNKEAEDKFNLYGLNSIYIDVKPLWKIVVESIKNPFYIYQVFIMIVWSIQSYFSFAFCIFSFSVITIALQGHETRKQDKLLRAKVQSENEVTVIRNSRTQSISSNQLVPGDLLEINKPCALNCDAVLVEGSCKVNESMLTGECVPIAKSALNMDPESIYSPKINKKYTLYCGTEIVQISAHNAKAIVIRTGYSTAKGELVKAILFPKDENSFLNSDLIKCMQLFFLIGLPCMIYSGLIFYSYKVKVFQLIVIVMDIATFLVPPMLPSVMTSINVHSQKRLLKNKIFCLNAICINSCGIIDTIVFDKTGTITEDSLDFASVLCTSNLSAKENLIDKLSQNVNEEDENLNKISNLSEINENSNDKSNFIDQPWTELKDKELNNLIMTVGCCHSLVLFENRIDGDILDLKMFEQLNWEIKIPENELNEITKYWSSPLKLERIIKTNIEQKNGLKLAIGVVKEFEFESFLQRMLVIVKPILYSINNESNELSSFNNNDNYLILMKGAPEKIEKFCKPITIPSNYNEILNSYTVEGLRVIACASKIVNQTQLNNLNKSQITEFEDNLTFDGLIVFHNKLKKESKPTIEELKSIDIRCLMATGDNLLTGVNVARNCGLVDKDDQVIELKAELVDANSTNINAFVDQREYVEYVESDQQLEEKQIKLTYKILKRSNSAQHHNLTRLFSRKESNLNDQDEVRINMLDSVRKRRSNEQILNPMKWFRKDDQKNRLNKIIDELDNEFDLRKLYHLAVEGNTFQLLKFHNQTIFNYLTHKGSVFARMAPNQKEQLITSLQKQEHIVAMVGDGANDCAALRNANCALALSSGESAVAAPFSTTESNISVLKYLICEGKATITATFGAFKYQVSYCFILLAAVMILFYDGCSPTDNQFVLTDIVLNILCPMVFGTTAAYYKLVKRRPSKILFGFSTLFSIFSFVFLQTCFYLFTRWLLTQQIWYEPFKLNIEQYKPSQPSDIATTIISVNIMSYVISAIIFSPGHPFRKSFFSNKLYLAVVLINLLIVITISFYPSPKFLIDYINLKEIPFNFKIFLLIINIVNFIVSYVWEVFILQNVLPILQERYSNLNFNRKISIYEQLDHELCTIKWPPVLFE